MRKKLLEFCRRGLLACWLGPAVLAVIYLVLHRCGGVELLTVGEVTRGIFSLTALAFAAGGMNVVYQIERLPLMVAVLIHGAVLYAGYLEVYLLNGWLQRGMTPLLMFTAIFVGGYFLIWAVIYAATRKRTEKLNEVLKKKREMAEGV